MPSVSPDMTIRDVRVTMLRLPWADDPWLRGHALGATRDILVCDVETAGGITGMGYLFLFRPGMKSIAACLHQCLIPRREREDDAPVGKRPRRLPPKPKNKPLKFRHLRLSHCRFFLLQKK